MGSSASRRERKIQREVQEANRKVIFFRCCGRVYGGSAVDSDVVRTSTGSESSVAFPNYSVSAVAMRSIDENSKSNVLDKGDTVVLPESNVTSNKIYLDGLDKEFESHMNLVLPSSHDHRYSQSSTMIPSTTNNSSYQTFEPTPLTHVLPQLYLGTQEDAEQEENIISLGITHIVSIVGGGRYKDLWKHMYIPLRDNGSSDLLEKLEKSYDFMVESQNYGNKLFIYCQLGQNRSASLLIGFLMRWKNLTLHEAYTFLKEKRELIHPHKKYIEQLRELDKELYNVYSTPENFLDIELCEDEGVKILHHDFCRAASRKYQKSQRGVKGEQDESFNSSLLGEDLELNSDRLIRICLPESDDGGSISTNAKSCDKNSQPVPSGSKSYKF